MKLFLNLSKEEQRIRLLRRIDLPDHNWKFSSADVEEREYWDDYQQAFSEMLSHTSTEWAPWYVIPADRKWFARIAAAAVIAHTLIEIDPRYPTVDDADPARSCRRSRTTLEAQAPAGAARRPVRGSPVEDGDDGHRARWHALEPRSSPRDSASDLDAGLSAAEAAARLERDGPNALPAEKPPPALRRFLAQYTSYMQLILVGAAVVSLAIKEWSTAVLLS